MSRERESEVANTAALERSHKHDNRTIDPWPRRMHCMQVLLAASPRHTNLDRPFPPLGTIAAYGPTCRK